MDISANHAALYTLCDARCAIGSGIWRSRTVRSFGTKALPFAVNGTGNVNKSTRSLQGTSARKNNARRASASGGEWVFPKAGRGRAETSGAEHQLLFQAGGTTCRMESRTTSVGSQRESGPLGVSAFESASRASRRASQRVAVGASLASGSAVRTCQGKV